MCGELHTKIGKREEAVRVVETLLILPVAAFHLAVVMRRIRADDDHKACSGQLKVGWQIFLAVGKAIGKRKSVIRLHALYLYAAAFEPRRHLLQKISVRIGALLRICSRTARVLYYTAPLLFFLPLLSNLYCSTSDTSGSQTETCFLAYTVQ